MRCWWWFFHAWNKWEPFDVPGQVWGVFDAQYHDTVFKRQQRVCSLCGWTQVRDR